MRSPPEFKPLKRLASGSFGDVVLAVREGTQQQVVLKFLNPHMFVGATLEEEILEGIQAIGRLIADPRIVAVTEYGGAEGEFYLVEPFVFGDTVQNLVLRANAANEPIPITVALTIVQEAAAAVASAHRIRTARYPAGVASGDLTPRNIMVGFEDGAVRVLDVGTIELKRQCQRGSLGPVPGRSTYLSPEQVADDRVDARSDVFTLGVVLHELLTRRALFQRRDEFETVMAIRSCKIDPPSRFNADVSPELDALVLRAVAAEPDRRFANGAELENAIAELPGYAARHESFHVRDFIRLIYSDYLARKGLG
jgi:serine/threonine protein kinase